MNDTDQGIEPQEWATFLNAFTARNRGRRARFKIFSQRLCRRGTGSLFHKCSIDGHTVTVKRHYKKHLQETLMTDELKNILGVSVQYDTDKSEDMLELTKDRNELTTLHFKSLVDGDS